VAVAHAVVERILSRDASGRAACERGRRGGGRWGGV